MTHAQRILVVEDDPGVLRLLVRLLDRDGFVIEGIQAGAEAEAAIGRFCPELIILDIGLPDTNGFDLLRRIRARHTTPVIVVSGRDQESDRVLGLELGADDYIGKPFGNEEMMARVRARLRTHDAATVEMPPPAGLGLEVDPRTREVTVDGVLVELTATEFNLLHHLWASPRQVFTREQLLEAVWQSSEEWQGTNTVTEYIRRLRRKVGDDRLVTVRGVGYRYEPGGG